MSTVVLVDAQPSMLSGSDQDQVVQSTLRRYGEGVWMSLARAGQRRAAADIARLVRLRGGTATGDLHQDLQHVVIARGLL